MFGTKAKITILIKVVVENICFFVRFNIKSYINRICMAAKSLRYMNVQKRIIIFLKITPKNSDV